MIKIMTSIRGDHCGRCGNKRSIEIYDKFNRAANYSLLLDNVDDTNIVERFNNRELTHMKCKRCGFVYCIDWREGIPMPLREFSHIDNFLYDNYNK